MDYIHRHTHTLSHTHIYTHTNQKAKKLISQIEAKLYIILIILI